LLTKFTLMSKSEFFPGESKNIQFVSKTKKISTVFLWSKSIKTYYWPGEQRAGLLLAFLINDYEFSSNFYFSNLLLAPRFFYFWWSLRNKIKGYFFTRFRAQWAKLTNGFTTLLSIRYSFFQHKSFSDFFSKESIKI
jgi:hypothetical protein